MKLKPIGIRKDRVWLIPATLICTISVIIAVIVSWWFYSDEFDYEYLLENGVEVEATVVDYDYHSESYSDGDSNHLSGWYYIWECYYNGRRYWGTAPNGYLRTEEDNIWAKSLPLQLILTVVGWLIKQKLKFSLTGFIIQSI